MLSGARLARRTREVLREEGPRSLMWHTLAVAGARRLAVYCRDMEAELAPVTVPGVTVRPMEPADLGAYRRLRPDIAGNELKRRLRSGDRCLTAWRGNRLIATYWVAARDAPVPYLGISVPLNDGVWFVYDVFTAPQERKRGLHDLLRFEAVRQGRREGASALLSAILPENRAGRRLVSRSRPLGTLLSIRLGRRLLTRSNVPPEYLGRPRRTP
jgi:hypothetical protein